MKIYPPSINCKITTQFTKLGKLLYMSQDGAGRRLKPRAHRRFRPTFLIFDECSNSVTQFVGPANSVTQTRPALSEEGHPKKRTSSALRSTFVGLFRWRVALQRAIENLMSEYTPLPPCIGGAQTYLDTFVVLFFYRCEVCRI